MNKSLIITLLIAAALFGSSFTANAAWPNVRKGSGKTATREMTVAPFTAVSAGNGSTVTLVTGSGPAVIEVDDNLMEYVEVKVKNGTLTVGFNDDCSGYSNYTLRVTVPTDGKLKQLQATGASKIVAEPVLKSDEMKVYVSGASNLVAVVKCNACEIDIKGASKAELGGDMGSCEVKATGASNFNLVAKVDRCTLAASGASEINASGSARSAQIASTGASGINASDFVVSACTVKASGASNARVNCSEQLTADASGASKIVYTGNCSNNTIESSGASTVKRR